MQCSLNRFWYEDYIYFIFIDHRFFCQFYNVTHFTFNSQRGRNEVRERKK